MLSPLLRVADPLIKIQGFFAIFAYLFILHNILFNKHSLQRSVYIKIYTKKEKDLFTYLDPFYKDSWQEIFKLTS